MTDGPTDLAPREAWHRYLDGRQTELTEETASTYHYRLKLFGEWCEDQGIETVDELNGWLFDQYESYRAGQDIASVTLHNEMETLKNFVEYLERIEAVNDDLAERVNVPHVPRDERSRETKLPTERALALIRHYRSSETLRGCRRHALLEVAWHTGARLGGLRALDLRDYDRDEQTIEFVHRPESETVLKNKGEGERVVALNERVCETISTYIQSDRYDEHDEHGRQPLFASRQGRPNPNTIRVWMYLATFPCIQGECPHGYDPDACEFRNHSKASQCPSSRAPHHIRTGSITWHCDRGVPREVTAERVNASQDVIDEYYDKSEKRDRMEKRRRPHLNKLNIE
ncbi:tyrosine-type recombinase/integrase [Natrinema versiforme]|uniref:XerC/D-like integrase n=1 Tax=Natrinema versiforme JCM 10478 TaxID=1227496 RepID=L9XU03_9EURY|nr:tyrosine-type recombinase/integrase [Natrinema versiforme]ELY64886.1 XerC/D-like integrase [Natrinema versiforme JCM 10478]